MKKSIKWLACLMIKLLVVFLSTYQVINLSTAFAGEVEVSGFVDVFYQQEEEGGCSFGIGAFEIDFANEFSEKVSFEGAVVVEGGEVGLGQTLINFKLPDDKLSLQAGLLDIPFGIDYQVFATPDRKLISPPLATELIMDGGWADPGLNLYGALSLINYNIYIVNGMGEDSGDPVNQDIDNNNAKTIGSRIGISPGEGLEVGVSYARGSYLDDNNDEILSRFGCDVQLGLGPIKIKGEYITVEEEIPLANANEHSGYYIQLLGNLTENAYGAARLGGWEPEKGDETTRITLGFGYNLKESVFLRFEYQINNEKPEVNDNLASTQVVISF